MNKQSKLYKRSRGAHAIAGASGLALIMGLVNVAVGANVVISAATTIANPLVDLTIDSDHPLSISTPQFFQGVATGAVTGSSFQDVSSGSSTIAASDNTLSAAAGGNSALSSATIDLLDTTADFSLGSAQATALNGTTQSVTASVTGSPLVNILFSAPVSQATLTGNAASAQVAVNNSVASIVQANLQGFATPASGSAMLDGAADPSTVDVTANGVIANYQKAVNAGGMTGSAASVSASTSVDATSAGSSLAAGAAITLSGNQVTASYGANDASNRYEGSGTGFDGSLIIANLQDNIDDQTDGTAAPTATIDGSGIAVSTGANAIDGDITITAQTFEAQSGGNSAINRLVLDVATGVNGTAAAAPFGIASIQGAIGDATVGIVTAQRNDGANLASSITDSHIEVSGTGGAGAITLSDNSSQASATGNTAANRLSIQAGAMDEASAVIANAQVNDATTVQATNTSDMLVSGIGSTAIAHAGPVVLSGNSIGSSAVGSTASNLNLAASDTGIDSTATTGAFITNNNQFSSLGQVTAATIGNIGVNLNGAAAVNATLAGNTIDSSVKTNVATNGTVITAGSGDYTGSITSQQIGVGDASATTTASILAAIIDSEVNASSALTLSGNTIRASASGNEATNQFSNTVATALAAGTGARFLSNEQMSGGTITSTVGDATTPVALGIVASGSVGGTADVLNNALKSVAIANSALNTVALTAGTTLDVAAAAGSTLANNQTSTSVLSSTTTGSVFIDVVPTADPAITGTANVIGNTLQALGTQNEAFNTLALAAGTTVSGSGTVLNEQFSLGSTTVAVDSAGFGIRTTGAVGADAGITGVATVTGNVLQSQAIANRADNSLSIVSGTGSTAAGAVVNFQTNAIGAVNASTTITGLGVAADGSLEGTATAGANQVSALAFGNNASNALNARGGSGALNGTLSSSSNQTNGAAVTSRVSGPIGTSVAVGLTAAAPSVTGYTANLLKNSVSSAAYGNSADNVLNALSTGANTASAQLASYQVNTGAITALVSNAGMGIAGVAGAPTVAGSSVISGNTISATAMGNSSVSQMVIGR